MGLAAIDSRSGLGGDLIVFGWRDGDGSPGVGSVQYALVNHAHGPVAVIPQQNA